MTAIEAYKIAKMNLLKMEKGAENRWSLAGACDFGRFYGFVFQPVGEHLYGTCYHCVDKESGKISYFLPQSDFSLYDSRIKILISSILNDGSVF